jgi:hypothetical protein
LLKTRSLAVDPLLQLRGSIGDEEAGEQIPAVEGRGVLETSGGNSVVEQNGVAVPGPPTSSSVWVAPSRQVRPSTYGSA